MTFYEFIKIHRRAAERTGDFRKGDDVKTINRHQTKTHLSELLSRVKRGEEIIISTDGIPLAKRVPLNLLRERVPGIAKGTVTLAFFEPLPDDEMDGWMHP
jgi:antitoxin (DNA-binding transcriptional repressor) of toxin-antitoxin stability system